MTKLLPFAIEVMTQEGYALSDLAGDTQRYGTFGWEPAGRKWNFTITRRSFSWNRSAHEQDATGAATFKITLAKDINDRRCDGIEQIIELHQQSRIPILKRARELAHILLGRVGKQVWLAKTPDGQIAAYVVATPGQKAYRIDEFGGTADAVQAVIAHFINSLGADSVHLSSPWTHPLNKKFFRISASWHVACLRNIKIIDLEKTLSGFAPQLAQRYRNGRLKGKYAVALQVADTEQRVGIELSADGIRVQPGAEVKPIKRHQRRMVRTAREFSKHGVTEKPSPHTPMIILPERQMVRLLFGPGSPSASIGKLISEANLEFLDALFPLDFYISYGLESV